MGSTGPLGVSQACALNVGGIYRNTEYLDGLGNGRGDEAQSSFPVYSPLFLSSTYLIFFMLAMSGANWYFGIAPMVLSQNPSVLNVNQWYVATKVTLLGHRAEAMNL